MIAGLEPYPDYKPSGVEWLGDTPAHWGMRRLKYVVKLVMGQSPSGSDCSHEPIGLPFLQGCAEFGESHPCPVQFCRAPQKISPIGAILMSVRAPVGRLNIANQKYGIGRGLCAVLPDGKTLQTKFTHYQLEILGDGLRLVSTGSTYDAVSVGDVGNQPVIIPPLAEQAAIAHYLDNVTGRIRRCIDARERLIGLLEEKRRAVIHHAVTRGLDPNVRLKPSGVEWLGDVPAHWDVAALKHRYSQCLGKMLDSKRITGNYLIPYLRNTDVQWNRINIEDLPEMDIPPNEYSRYTVQHGDLLVCEGGDVGRCALWSGELAVCGFQKALHRLRPQNVGWDVPRFMYYVLHAAVNGNAFNDGHMSTIEHLTGDKFRTHRFPFPPFAEQAAIAAHLDKATAAIDAAVACARRQIELLREYRARLTADVVTGKLDVREATANLPDESGESVVLLPEKRPK